IILDEPTAALTVADRRQLFDFMRRLQAAGVTFIFISHYHDEILAICDAVTVLRDGRLAGGSDDIGSMTSVALSEWVIGRGLELFQRIRRDHTGKPPAVSLRGIQGKALSLDRLDIGAGEIVGFTGLPGAGAKESARAILACIRPVAASQLTVRPHRLCRKGHAWPSILALLIFPMTAVVKGGLGRCRSGPISPSLLCLAGEMGVIDRRAEALVIAHYFAAMGVKALSPDDAVNTLSGGNQQKVCLGRVFATQPRLLMVDEPTRGIDVGVKQDVLRIIDELSDAGVAVIIVSTDMDELARSVDRVCIFEHGAIKEILTGDDITAERLRASVQA
ncbi:sugar ABC transporter ATP-binding protein, partial [Yersinia pestis]